MISDQEWSTRSLESILGPNGYAVMRAFTGSKGLERAKSSQPDLIILDANLPDFNSTDLCRELRADPAISSSTPIIMTTSGPATRQHRMTALRAGAWDYLGHPLDAEELLLRLDAYTRAKLDADAAREEGLLDQITGLYNVQGLARRAKEMGSQAFRHHGALACLVFTPNAHAAEASTAEAAEAATLAAAHRLADVLKATVRVSDVIGRLGQTEFAVFAPDTDSEGAVRFAERLSKLLQTNGEAPLRAGYHAVRDFHEASIEPVDLLVRASTALRRSKGHNGGGADWLTGFDAPHASGPH